MVRPPRRIQELQARIGAAQEELELTLGRSARPSELAQHLDEELSNVVEALAADGCFTATSLDAPVGDGTSSLGDLLGSEARENGAMEARLMLSPLVSRLGARDRHVLRMRYFEDRTQQEIAQEIGITQAQVSRILGRILDGLRAQLTEQQPPAA